MVVESVETDQIWWFAGFRFCFVLRLFVLMISVYWRCHKDVLYWYYIVFIIVSWQMILHVSEYQRNIKSNDFQAFDVALLYYRCLKIPMIWHGHKEPGYWFAISVNSVLWKLVLNLSEGLRSSSNSLKCYEFQVVG